MKRMMLIWAVLLSVVMLTACSDSSEKPVLEADSHESSTEQIKEEPITEEPSTLTGTQQYSNDYISFEYDADLMSVLENGEGLDYTIAVMQNNAESIVPHVDMLGLDTTDIGSQLTAEQFENLSKEAVAQYYGVSLSELSMSVTGTEINTTDLNHCYASTILTVKETEDTPVIYVESKLLYNESNGVMCIALLDDDLESSEMVPYLKVLESIQLKT